VDAASATLLVHGSSTFVTAGQHLLGNSSGTSGSGSSSGTQETSADTVRAAQREAQRQEGIPTSQQPEPQKSTIDLCINNGIEVNIEKKVVPIAECSLAASRGRIGYRQ
jgi:hypothetical protein